MNNIKIIKGNIFTTSCQTIVNTVNCLGVMGAGIALEFRYRYPLMYEKYIEFCEAGKIQIGTLWLYNKENGRKWVLNFPTKYNWKYETKPEYLEKGLKKFVETYKEKGITSIAFPLLGADKGGLNPDLSLQIMEQYLSLCDIPVEIYQYNMYAEDDLINSAREIFLIDKTMDIAKRTGVDAKTITKIQKSLSNNNIYSLIQLSKVNGIGEVTLEKCFQLVIKHNPQPTVKKQDLFSIPSNEFKSINASSISMNKKFVDMSLSEKAKKTGLDTQILINIEQQNDNVTLRDIKTYCEKLQINPVKIINNFFNNTLSIPPPQ